MKRIFAFLTVLALLAVPVSAMAVKAGDWELVGYTKLETYWDSIEVNKNLSGPLVRSTAVQPNNIGRLRFTAQSSRFGLRVNGPDFLGAKTQGYIEIDFDSSQDAQQSASNSYVPRMRHAWFRMDWPGGLQLLMGQYWGVFDDFYPETVNDGPFQNHGQATQRIPQARLTWKSGLGSGPWTIAGLVGVPYDPTNTDNATAAFNTANNTGFLVGSAAPAGVGNFQGQRATVPQIQGQVIYEKDLYGKAAFANRPRGFTVDIAAGMQRTQYLGGQLNNPFTFGKVAVPNAFGAPDFFSSYQQIGVGRTLLNRTQTLTPWVVQGTLFIPVLVTHTDNLARTASISIQGQIGQGFSFFGNGADTDNSFFKYDSPGFASTNKFNPNSFVPVINYTRRLTPKYGGYIQGQYYFTNQVYASVVYGFDKSYGVSNDRNGALSTLDPSNVNGFTYATNATDQSNFTQELAANMFWTPNKNLKFGLMYSLLQTSYFQATGFANPFLLNNANFSPNNKRWNTNHSVRFGGWFFF
jgi:hypothetical protein